MKNTVVNINPATGKKTGQYRLQTAKDVIRAVEKARKAQPAWEALSLKRRSSYVLKIRDYIVANSDRIAETISIDNGKAITDAMATEVVPAAMAAGYYCRHAGRFMRESKIHTGNVMFINKRSSISRVPFGVVGIISPWNYPFAIPFSEVVMALLAGNAVILKVARETPMVGDLLKECFEAGGLPENIFSYINVPGPVIGDALVEAGVDKIFFTGSVGVGKYLMQQAAKKLIPVVLELGGNDPMIICDDADLERAASGAVWAGISNAGQSCGGVERVYVHESVYAPFLALLKRKVESLRVGVGQDFSTDIGAITVQRQMETIDHHVKEALKKGATLYAKSDVPKNLKGQFMPCMVLTDVNHDMLVMREETFGPVLGVMPYKTTDEAVELANDSHLGLTASVWSRDSSRAVKIARRIRAGAILINDHLMSHGMAETPWGGFRESGIGRTHGEIGFHEMTQPKVIMKDLMPFARRNFWWHPYDKRTYEGLRSVIDILYSRSILRRLTGLPKLLRAFVRTFRAI
jgi:succinate-semialdehyde dehydrogenase/glutarate-semialdehyde dehydrogenase